MNKFFVFLFLLLISFALAGKRKIYLMKYNTDIWLDESEISKLQRPGEKVNFIDITDDPDFYFPTTTRVADFPSRLVKQDVVKDLIGVAVRESTKKMTDTIVTLSTKYAQRTCNSEIGAASVDYILQEAKKIAENSPKAGMITFEKVPTSTYAQPSLIIRMKGKNNKVIVVGGHIDSIRGPGADDNGSGSAGVLEVFRIIAESKWENEKTIEFHFYACEEAGLIGSGVVARKYKSSDVQVHAMLNLDMICYFKQKKTALITSSTSSQLNEFTKLVMREYGSLPFETKSFMGGSSDHAQWTRNGYHSTWPWENPNNPNIHGGGDLIDKCDMINAVEFIKISLGFVVELGYN